MKELKPKKDARTRKGIKRNVPSDKKCTFVKADGTECKGFKIKGSPYCYSHSPKELRSKRNMKSRLFQIKNVRNKQ